MSKAAAEVKQENRFVRYFKETRAELRKVHWPTRREALNLTTIVLAATVAMAILLGVLDYFFTWLAAGVLAPTVDPIRVIIVAVLGLVGIVALVIGLRRQ
ncbi:MAG TPA: preprotein translocase subunit SecE [Anaerolineae bacterium]|nr:preprotein translocase subunit SecE [Anaerolineae bacterium]